MTIVIGLCVVGLMAFGLALSYYKNILFDRQLQTMQERNNRLKLQIANGNDNLQYLESAQYRDKYAKENFGLLKPGEKVLLVNRPSEQVTVSQNNADLTPEEKQAIFEENLRSIRVVDQWKLYLFNRDRIDDLKKNT